MRAGNLVSEGQPWVSVLEDAMPQWDHEKRMQKPGAGEGGGQHPR